MWSRPVHLSMLFCPKFDLLQRIPQICRVALPHIFDILCRHGRVERHGFRIAAAARLMRQKLRKVYAVRGGVQLVAVHAACAVVEVRVKRGDLRLLGKLKDDPFVNALRRPARVWVAVERLVAVFTLAVVRAPRRIDDLYRRRVERIKLRPGN